MGIVNMESFIRENTGKDQVKEKLTDRKYHVQGNADFSHKDVKMYCDTHQFPTLPFCGSHPKPRGARRLSKIMIYSLIQN